MSAAHYRFKSKSSKAPFLFSMLCGGIAGVSAFLFVLIEPLSYLNERPETCVNCHVMGNPFSTWNHSSHREPSVCVDCHLPHDNVVHKYMVKGRDGLKDLAGFALHRERQVAQASEQTRKHIMGNCISCHLHLFAQSKVKGWRDKHTYDSERLCWECHREVPHGRTRGLASTPWAGIQYSRPESRVPSWLRVEMGEEPRGAKEAR